MLKRCLEEIARCDLFILVVGYRCGWIPRPEDGGNGEKSITQKEYEFWKVRSMLCGQWPAIVFMATNDDSYLSSNATEEERARQVLFRSALQAETTVHRFRFIPAGAPGHAEAVREFGTLLREQLIQAKDRLAERTHRQSLKVQAEAQRRVKEVQDHVHQLQAQLVAAQLELKKMQDHKPGDALALLGVGGLIGAALAKGH